MAQKAFKPSCMGEDFSPPDLATDSDTDSDSDTDVMSPVECNKDMGSGRPRPAGWLSSARAAQSPAKGTTTAAPARDGAESRLPPASTCGSTAGALYTNAKPQSLELRLKERLGACTDFRQFLDSPRPKDAPLADKDVKQMQHLLGKLGVACNRMLTALCDADDSLKVKVGTLLDNLQAAGPPPAKRCPGITAALAEGVTQIASLEGEVHTLLAAWQTSRAGGTDNTSETRGVDPVRVASGFRSWASSLTLAEASAALPAGAKTLDGHKAKGQTTTGDAAGVAPQGVERAVGSPSHPVSAAFSLLQRRKSPHKSPT